MQKAHSSAHPRRRRSVAPTARENTTTAPREFDRPIADLVQSELALRDELEKLPGLLHYFVGIDRERVF